MTRASAGEAADAVRCRAVVRVALRRRPPPRGGPTPPARRRRRKGPVAPAPMTAAEARARRKSLAGPKLSREERREQSAARRAQMADRRERMMAGDERYLLTRDQGPVRRYVRDMVDARRNVLGLFMPSALALLFIMFAVAATSVLHLAGDAGADGSDGARRAPPGSQGRPTGGREVSGEHRKPLEIRPLRGQSGLANAPDAGAAAPVKHGASVDPETLRLESRLDPPCEPWCSAESGQESPGGRRPPSPSR